MPMMAPMMVREMPTPQMMGTSDIIFSGRY
jgi:hypothetical protein